ncbi:hypothetical protein [Ligaoa zhengdingensis]|uniref:hypothetical protein n=1 Tax=Ligaoa zhengdingensis TaxID=2763658 RepID=UPI0031BA7C13
MKKLIAVLLAFMLMAETSNIAFAKRIEDMGELKSNLYLYDEENDKLQSDGVGSTPVPSGSVLYLPLDTYAENKDGDMKFSYATKLSDLQDYRLRYKVTEGNGLVESVRFAIQNDYDGHEAGCIAIKTKSNATSENAWVTVEITVIPRNGATIDEIEYEDETELNFQVAPAAASDAVQKPTEEAKPSQPETPSTPAESAPTVGGDVEQNPDTGLPDVLSAMAALLPVGCGLLILCKK